MSRVNVILDITPEYLMDNNYNEKRYKKTKNEKTVKIDWELFEIALDKGLIEKTDDGYVFVGKYEDIQEIKKKKH